MRKSRGFLFLPFVMLLYLFLHFLHHPCHRQDNKCEEESFVDGKLEQISPLITEIHSHEAIALTCQLRRRELEHSR